MPFAQVSPLEAYFAWGSGSEESDPGPRRRDSVRLQIMPASICSWHK